MHRAIQEVLVTFTGARRSHPVVATRGPAMHHRVGHVRVKLEAEGVAGLKCLHWEVVALGEQLGPMRQLKPLAVPMVDALRPVRAERMSSRGRTDRVIADLGAALRMRRDPGAELPGEHLSAQANAEKRTLLAQRNL